MFNPKTNETEPLFKPQEVAEQLREALDAARALTDAEQEKNGRTNILNPPSLANLLESHPDFKNYVPQGT
jgi:hypothetical protein